MLYVSEVTGDSNEDGVDQSNREFYIVAFQSYPEPSLTWHKKGLFIELIAFQADRRHIAVRMCKLLITKQQQPLVERVHVRGESFEISAWNSRQSVG